MPGWAINLGVVPRCGQVAVSTMKGWLRTCLALLLGRNSAGMTSGQITYDLRRLRAHGIIERIPHTHRHNIPR